MYNLAPPEFENVIDEPIQTVFVLTFVRTMVGVLTTLIESV